MRSNKTILTLPLIIILVFAILLNACGGGGADTTPSDSTEHSTQATDNTAGSRDPSDDPSEDPSSPSGTEGTEASESTAPSGEASEPSEPPTDPSEGETEPTETQPSPTDPPQTEPQPTDPPETNPPAVEHHHSYSYKVTTPTCTAGGYTTFICSCGNTYKDQYTDPTGHHYITETVAPTKTSKGYDLHTCSSCGDSYKDNYKDKLTEEEAAKDILYTVIVVDSSGNPVQGIIVNCDGKLAGATNSSGKATFKKPAGNYSITVNYPNGDVPEYDTDAAKLTATKTSLTIIITPKAVANVPLSAPSLKSDSFTDHMAYGVGEGEVVVKLNADDFTYFIFTPTRSGIYRISAKSGAPIDVGYYGGPSYVLTNSIADVQNGSFDLDVHGYNIGDSSETTSKYVIGIKSLNQVPAGCTLIIERIGDIPITPEDVPWTVAKAESQYMVPFEGASGEKLTNININTVKLSDIVKGDDGLYYYKGKLLLVRIDSASEYLAAFTEICNTSNLGVYYYDDNGNFDYKLRFNEMIAEYAEICDENGVCPLNDQLINMIKDVGAFKYWWDFEANMGYIFGETPVNPETAWLFACCYYG